MLKLDSAEIKFPPAQSESSNLEKFTVICTKSRAYPLPAGAPMPNIPLELCFDDKKSVDRSEVITGKPKAMIDDVTLQEESDIVFDKPPPEVQKIIRLTSGEKYVKEKFHLSVLINSGGDPDRLTRKKTKDYLYHPGAEIKDNPSWAFKRQDNLLKLTQASLAPQK